MAPLVNILDQPESLKKPLVGSMVLHASVAAAVVLLSYANINRQYWGSNTVGGGSVAINVLHQIPMPANSGAINPVANDTHSEAPEPKPDKVKQIKVKEPPPDAIPLKSRTAPKKPSFKESSLNKYREKQIDRPNQAFIVPTARSWSARCMGSRVRGALGSAAGPRSAIVTDITSTFCAKRWRSDGTPMTSIRASERCRLPS